MSICTICGGEYRDLLPQCPTCNNQNPEIHVIKPTPTQELSEGFQVIPRAHFAKPVIIPALSKPKKDLHLLIEGANHQKVTLANFPIVRATIYNSMYRQKTAARISVGDKEFLSFIHDLPRSDYYCKPSCPFLVLAQTRGNVSNPLPSCKAPDIVAIRHLRNSSHKNKSVVSRLTLTFRKGSFTDIFKKIVGFHSLFEVIENFKIMGRDKFGCGPDDIVLYLNKPLRNESVRRLVSGLALDKYLITCFSDCDPQPLSLQRCSIGIYGTDIPQLNAAQAELLKIDLKTSGGSAGWLACSMATHLALYTRASSGKGLPTEQDYGNSIIELCKYFGLDPNNPAYTI